MDAEQEFSDSSIEDNMIDTTGYDEQERNQFYYDIDQLDFAIQCESSDEEVMNEEITPNTEEIEEPETPLDDSLEGINEENEYLSDSDSEISGSSEDESDESDDSSALNNDIDMTDKEKQECNELKLNMKKDDFYDDKIDDKNTEWIKKNRIISKGKFKSDATLSCPGCFQIICYECQRHEKYVSQFRSVIAFHTRVDIYQNLTYQNGQYKQVPKSSTRNNWKDPSINSINNNNINNDYNNDYFYFHPVYCEECETEIGVQDSNGMYIFYNIIENDPEPF
ncbi:hypothetical protein WA158_006030 [Blastocystis sp. Blastoise]